MNNNNNNNNSIVNQNLNQNIYAFGMRVVDLDIEGVTNLLAAAGYIGKWEKNSRICIDQRTVKHVQRTYVLPIYV